MKNRKGFTLIELIAVVVILGLILVIAIPVFTGSLKEFRTDYYTNLNGNTLNAGKEFFQENRIYLPTKYLDSAIVDANTLVNEKYIDDIKDYNGDVCDKIESYVIAIRKSRDEIIYDTCIKCSNDNYDNFDEKEACSLAWKDGEGFSEILFDKPEDVYIYRGTSRSELKKLVVAYPDVRRCLGKAGICEQEIMRVSGKGESGVNPIYPVNLDTVNPDVIGTYPVKYKYENYGTTVDGKVIVFENLAPTVKITKTNNVVSTNVHNDAKAVTTDYNPNNKDDWAQKLNFTFSFNFGSDAKPGLYVTKYQIFFNNRWEDYCTPAKGTNTCKYSELREMDENVRFRFIDSEGHISAFTEYMNLRIDRTKPSCTISSNGTVGDDKWYISDVDVFFTSKKDKDGTIPYENAKKVNSGILEYGITLGEKTAKETDTDKNDTDESGRTWYGYVEDKANNIQLCDTHFKRDATFPKCELQIPDPNGELDGDSKWHTQRVVKVTFKTHTDSPNGEKLYSDVEDYGLVKWNSNKKDDEHTTNSPSVEYIGEIKDKAGNKSTCKIWFKQDFEPPTCTAKVEAPTGLTDTDGKKWHTIKTVNASVAKSDTSDNLSGVDDYGLTTWNSGIKSQPHDKDTTGITYTFQIKDKAGNMNTCSVWFKKDSTPPSCGVETSGVKAVNNTWYKTDNNKATSVNASFVKDAQTDATSGVLYYGFNKTDWTKTASTTKSTSDGKFTGYIRDKAGNDASCDVSYKFDNEPPTCTSSGGSTWTNSKVTLKGTCKDTGYSDCVEDITKDYDKEINVTKQTPGTVYDKAGNSVECPKDQTVQIDKTKPTCSIANHGDLSCTDSNTDTNLISGIVKYSYTSGNASYTSVTKTNSWSKTVTISTKGTYTLYVQDAAGNTSDGVDGVYYQITYDGNSGTTSATSEVKRNVEYATLTYKATRAGYSFHGWNTSSTASSGLTSVKVDSDKTLYAVWNKCPAGTYNTGNSTTCTNCPSGYTSDEASTAKTQCYKDATPCEWTKTTKTCGVSEWNYSFGSSSTTTVSSCSNNKISCDADHYDKTYVSCSENGKYEFDYSYTAHTDSCSASSAFTCSSSTKGNSYTHCTQYPAGDYAKGVFTCKYKIKDYSKTTKKCNRSPKSYAFTSNEDKKVTSCSTGTSFTCNADHNGNSYVSKCDITKYKCASSLRLDGTRCYLTS